MRHTYKCIAFQFDAKLMQTFDTRKLPSNWRQEPPPASLQQLGDDWIKSGTSVIVAVPSVIIPSELNYLINPKHTDFPKLKIGKPMGFSFDHRMFK
jgi:RES domain-containing protein